MTAALAIEHIDVTRIKASPSNPRKRFTGIDELAADITSRGILQPLRVRPLDSSTYELVFGERRWRAAKKADLEVVPCIVEDLSAGAALELMLVELAQTSDVHPVEEAQAYQELHKKHGLSVEEIAARVGKSKALVYARLKLCELPEVARKAALAGELPASHALLIARIPDAKLQAEATKAILDDGELLSYRAAQDLVQREYMLRLEDAPFSLSDATLVPKAGACTTCPKRTGNQAELFSDVKSADVCTTCPKRTGNQAELFSDVKSADVCTDLGCHRQKVDALWRLKVKGAEAGGQVVLSEAETKKVFPYQGRNTAHEAKFVDLHEERWDGGDMVKVKKLVGKDVAVVLARDPTGAIRELVPKEAVEKALKAAAPKGKAKADSGPSQETVLRKKLELRKAVVALAVPLLVKAGQKWAVGALREVVSGRVGVTEAKLIGLLAPAFGITQENPEQREASLIEMEPKDLGLLLYLLDVLPNAQGSMWQDGYGGAFKKAVEALDIDLKKLEAEAKAAGKKPVAKAPVAKPAKKAKR